jgi:hypothetical protein
MRKTLLTAIVAGGAAISAIVSSGLASADSVASVGGAEHIEHISIMSIKATAVRQSIIVTGAFTAGGVAIAGKSIYTVLLPGGTFAIRYHVAQETDTFDPATCLITEKQAGTYVLRHGTRKFSDIHGSGSFVLRLVGVFRRGRSGACTGLSAPATFQQIFRASGPAHV